MGNASKVVIFIRESMMINQFHSDIFGFQVARHVVKHYFQTSPICRYQLLQGCRATACVAATIPTGACLVGKIPWSIWSCLEGKWVAIWWTKMAMDTSLRLDAKNVFVFPTENGNGSFFSLRDTLFFPTGFRFPGGHRSTHLASTLLFHMFQDGQVIEESCSSFFAGERFAFQEKDGFKMIQPS